MAVLIFQAAGLNLKGICTKNLESETSCHLEKISGVIAKGNASMPYITPLWQEIDVDNQLLFRHCHKSILRTEGLQLINSGTKIILFETFIKGGLTLENVLNTKSPPKQDDFSHVMLSRIFSLNPIFISELSTLWETTVEKVMIFFDGRSPKLRNWVNQGVILKCTGK